MMQQAAKRAQPGRGFHPHPADTVDAKLAPGEYVLPTDTVQQVGEENLDALLAATKTPGRGFSGKQGGKFFFAGGDLVPDEEKQKPSSFGDAAAVAQNPGTTAVPAPTAPATPRAQFVADQNAKLAQANEGLAQRTAQLNARAQPAPNSPSNTFPGNRMAAGGGASGAPAAPAQPSRGAAARFGGQANLEARTNDTNAGLQREQMQQEGANPRDAARGLIDQQRLGLDARRQAQDEHAKGFDIRKAQRAENIQQAIDRASPEQRSVMKEMYPDMFPSEKPDVSMQFVPGKIDQATGLAGPDQAIVLDKKNQTARSVPIGGQPQNMEPLPADKSKRVPGTMYTNNSGQVVLWTKNGGEVVG